jgi:peroxiredoxin
VLLLLTVLAGCHAKPKAAAGGGAPDFTVNDLQGKKISLADYRGKVVLLDFWATWCAPCLEEIPHFVSMQEKYAGQGFQAIGISMDDGPKPVQAFYQEHKLNYPVALGTAQLADSYGGILGLPVTFVINRDGSIRKKFVGATDTAAIEAEVVEALKPV